MPTAAPQQASFNAGEVSGLMYGRIGEYDRMKSAMKVCKNAVCRVEGPWTRRPGTYFVAECVANPAGPSRVVPFKFSNLQAYMLEFAPGAIRVYKNRAPIYDNILTITAITQANPCQVTYVGNDPANGDHIDIAGVVGMTQLNGRRFRLANVNGAANTFTLQETNGTDVNSTSYSAYVSGGLANHVLTIPTSYNPVSSLKFVQSADVLFIWDPLLPEAQLTRISDTNWTLSNTVFFDGPYMLENATSTTLTPSAATGNGITITASSTTGINNGSGFLTSDVGRLIRMKEGSTWGYAVIKTRVSSTQVTADVVNTLTNTNAKTVWRLGLYSGTTGYPTCGAFYGDRLYRGGVAAEPDRLDGSRVSDYDNLQPTATDGSVTDSHAVSFRLNSDDVQTIHWMRGIGNGLAVGTYEGEWLVSPSTTQEAITPTNINAKQSTPYGSANQQSVKVGTSVVYVEAGARRLRELDFQYYDNQLVSTDLTMLADHITKGNFDPADPVASVDDPSTPTYSGIKEIAYQKKMIPIIWAARNDGALIGLTYDKNEKVIGWHRHFLGGRYDDQNRPPKVTSVAVIPSADGSYDELWMVVQRRKGVALNQYIEYLTPFWEQGDNHTTVAHFVDSGIAYSGSPTTTISGLNHLAGETVDILADGATHPQKVVGEFGSITLDRLASNVRVGYAYESDGATLRFDAGAADGTAQGKIQRIHDVVFRLFDTLGLKVGPSFDSLRQLTFRTAADPMSQAVPLFTGDRGPEDWESGYSQEEIVCWRVSQPLPATVLAVMPRLQTQDGS